MSDEPNTIFLRLEGPLQAWSDNSKLVVRRTMEAPTKSGIIGLICCAMGLSREAAREHLPALNKLQMGVRIDRAGTRWWDYHTVGAGYGILTAGGSIKKTASTGKYETLITRREYLCDASFLVALHGDVELIRKVADKLLNPKWLLYLGRKCCPPALPILVTRNPADDNCAVGPREPLIEHFPNLESALASEFVPWRPRLKGERPKDNKLLIEWRKSEQEPTAPDDAEVWYDWPVSFDPPVHGPRLVQRIPLEMPVDENPLQHRTPPAPRSRANYRNTEYRNARAARLDADHGLCVFCKSPGTTVQHITYRRAGGNERPEDLRSLCRLCHDAVTMIEYGLGMGLDRINPEDPLWRSQIIAKRQEIINFRSLETRRRRLQPEEVE